MRSRMLEVFLGTTKFLAQLAMCGSIGGLVLAGTSLVETSGAAADVTVSPQTLSLKSRVGTIVYGMVTVTNTGASPETLTGAAGDPPFWPTWGGTCNLTADSRVISPGRSCTFQFGFKPAKKGHIAGQGTLSFQSGATANVQLKGVGQ